MTRAETVETGHLKVVWSAGAPVPVRSVGGARRRALGSGVLVISGALLALVSVFGAWSLLSPVGTTPETPLWVAPGVADGSKLPQEGSASHCPGTTEADTGSRSGASATDGARSLRLPTAGERAVRQIGQSPHDGAAASGLLRRSGADSAPRRHRPTGSPAPAAEPSPSADPSGSERGLDDDSDEDRSGRRDGSAAESESDSGDRSGRRDGSAALSDDSSADDSRAGSNSDGDRSGRSGSDDRTGDDHGDADDDNTSGRSRDATDPDRDSDRDSDRDGRSGSDDSDDADDPRSADDRSESEDDGSDDSGKHRRGEDSDDHSSGDD